MSAPVDRVPAAINATATDAATTATATATAKQRTRGQVTTAHTAGEEQIAAAGVLLAPGNPGGGEQRPHRHQEQYGSSGPPHREAAGIIQRQRWPEQDPDGRIRRQCPQSGTIQQAGDSRLVLAGNQGRHPRRHGSDDGRTDPDLAKGVPGEGSSGPAEHAHEGIRRRHRTRSP
ncbi:hypothetical protein ACWEKJ_20380 [Amycolatopsis thermoflava]